MRWAIGRFHIVPISTQVNPRHLYKDNRRSFDSGRPPRRTAFAQDDSAWVRICAFPGHPPRRTDPSTTLRAGSGAPGPRLQTDHSSTVMLSGVASVFCSQRSRNIRGSSRSSTHDTHIKDVKAASFPALSFAKSNRRSFDYGRPPRRTAFAQDDSAWVGFVLSQVFRHGGQTWGTHVAPLVVLGERR